MRIVEINALFLLNGRTVFREYELRTRRAQCEAFPIKFLDLYSLLMPPQAPFFDPYERTCHSRTDLICTKGLTPWAAEPAPAPAAEAENLCISRHHIRTNPGFPRAPCQWLGVQGSSVKNVSSSPSLCSSRSLQTRLPFNSCLMHTKRLLCRKGHFRATATALRQALNILSLVIIFTRNSSFKRCVWLASEEQLQRGKIKALEMLSKELWERSANAFLH